MASTVSITVVRTRKVPLGDVLERYNEVSVQRSVVLRKWKVNTEGRRACRDDNNNSSNTEQPRLSETTADCLLATASAIHASHPECTCVRYQLRARHVRKARFTVSGCLVSEISGISHVGSDCPSNDLYTSCWEFIAVTEANSTIFRSMLSCNIKFICKFCLTNLFT